MRFDQFARDRPAQDLGATRSPTALALEQRSRRFTSPGDTLSIQDHLGEPAGVHDVLSYGQLHVVAQDFVEDVGGVPYRSGDNLRPLLAKLVTPLP